MTRRLVDAGLSVLVLEAGPADERPEIADPLGSFSLFGSEVDWAFTSVPQRELGGRTLYQPRGKTLGGSTALNGMLCVRGAPADYDGWAAAGAAAGPGATSSRTSGPPRAGPGDAGPRGVRAGVGRQRAPPGRDRAHGADDDRLAVVDPQLRVRGVTGLRVADASVMPLPPAGNTAAPVLMIGERAADFILAARTGAQHDGPG